MKYKNKKSWPRAKKSENKYSWKNKYRNEMDIVDESSKGLAGKVVDKATGDVSAKKLKKKVVNKNYKYKK